MSENVSATLSLRSFQYLKNFSEEIGDDIKKCYFLILCYAMFQHLEDMYSSENQYFPNEQWMMFQNYV